MQSAANSHARSPKHTEGETGEQEKQRSRERREREGNRGSRKSQAAMAIPSAFSPTHLAIFLVLAVAAIAPLAFAGDHALGWVPHGPTCTGSIGECLDDVDEFTMESEISRRILATSKYISYAALRRNSVPCSRRGASYYNCRPGAQANPYRRGCNAITRCRP